MQAGNAAGVPPPAVPAPPPPAPPPPPMVNPFRPHAVVQQSSTKDKIVVLLTISIVFVLASLNERTAKVGIYFAYANIVIALVLLFWFYVMVPIFLAVVRMWFALLGWLLSPDGYAIHLARLQEDSEALDEGIARVGGVDMAPGTALDVMLEEAIEGEFTDARKETRRQRYRRLAKDGLIVKMVQHARRKLGMGLQDKLETRLALDKVMRDFCADLCVRHLDRDKAMPWAKELYFLPTEGEIGAAGMAKGWFFWMQWLRLRGFAWMLLGFGSPAANHE